MLLKGKISHVLDKDYRPEYPLTFAFLEWFYKWFLFLQLWKDFKN